VDAPGGVAQRSTKETATATTRTTTAAAITTVAIAVKQQSKVEKLGQNSANNANAWTLRISLITAPNVTKAKINVVWQTTKAMATVTTKTITVVAITTAVIAALRLSSKNSAKNASVLIPPPTNVTKAKIHVVRQNSKAMETVTTTTTTVVAITTAVIAARKHSRRQLKKNTAKSASAWIRRANKLCFFFATRFFLRFILRY